MPTPCASSSFVALALCRPKPAVCAWSASTAGDFVDGDDSGRTGGYHSGVVPGLAAGTEYLYGLQRNADIVTGRAAVLALPRNDPCARVVRGRVRRSVVCDAGDFPWSDAGFVVPDKERMVMYEMHPGTRRACVC